jgi:hypothetical protein
VYGKKDTLVLSLPQELQIDSIGCRAKRPEELDQETLKAQRIIDLSVALRVPTISGERGSPCAMTLR